MATFELLAAGLARALRPLAYGMDSEDGVRIVVAALGWELPTVPPSLIALGQDLGQLNSSLADLVEARQRVSSHEGTSSEVDSALQGLVLDLALVVKRFHDLPEQLRSELPAAFIAATHIDQQIESRIFDFVLSLDLATNSPLLYRLLRVAGVIEATDQVVDENTLGPAFGEHHIRWDRLFKITDPAALAREVYGWGTPEIDSERLFTEMIPLGMALSMPPQLHYASSTFSQRNSPGVDVNAPPTRQLWIPVFRSDEASFFVVATALPKASPTELQALAFGLVPSAGGEFKIPLTDQLELSVKASTEIGTGASLILRPDRAPEVVVDMEGPAGKNLTSGSVAAALTWRAAQWQKPDGMSAASGTNITASSISFGVGADASAAKTDVYAELAIEDGKLVVAASDDGLLASVLPKDGLTATFSLALRWSQDGLHFRGSAGLATTIPLNLSIGPVLLQALDISLKVDQDALATEVGVTASVELGPLLVTIERVGLSATARAKAGNLGPVDLDISFKPPVGVGLVVSAPTVVGGGFLQFDPQQGQYSGFLELKIAERISVKGFGLLNTRLPGGGKGFSLVILIFVEGFNPIPLGLGFNLSGIGGLLALNRTFDENALRTGLKQHTLDSVLFPQDPIRNAPQIISNLNRVFPPATGHHLFGPMVQITWGTPPLITAEIGIVLELGARHRLLLLAQVFSVLPRPEHDLVRLQMDAIGVIDFDQGTAALDASLYDSRLLQKFPLTGDMALRLSWQSSPNFALAVGGLHPAFNPPPNFPKLERIAINLSSGDNPRLRCEAYFALTSNTVQFGARAELFASAAGFSIHGDIGFDVLIQFDPFYFIADFHAQLQLKRGSTNLFKVELKGSLEGPRPLHLKGKATFSIFWWDISIRIDKTLISGEKPPPPAPVEVLPRLQEALGQPGNWTAQLPAGTNALVQLRANAGAATDIRLHPLGTLTVKQGVVPLNMDISRFGQAAPAGPRRFTITSVNLGGKEQNTTPIKDFFAPAQFIELTDDQKLSRPSFEAMEAGLSFGSDALSFTTDSTDLLEVKTIEFETWIMDSETGEARRSEAEKPQPQQPPLFYQLNHTLLLQQARFGAAGSSALRRTGSAKYRAATTGKYQVTKEGWSVVAGDDLTKQPVRKPESYTEAVESLRQLQQQDATKAASLTILRLSEVTR
ncbi:MAG TPA: DUF6603 domain-containing protein [Pyrinomonadaceae bacterium]|nr:DUF6603 domain-containing protein [Pyrinomonadaceae bacterium]